MSTIVFERFRVTGAGAAVFPAMVGHGYQAAANRGLGQMPPMAGAAHSVTQSATGSATLPAMHGRGYQVAINYGGANFPALHGKGYTAVPARQVNYGNSALPRMRGAGVIQLTLKIRGDGSLPAMGGKAWGHFTGAHGNGVLPAMRGSSVNFGPPLSWLSALQGPGYLHAVCNALNTFRNLDSDSALTLGDGFAVSLGQVTRDTLALTDSAPALLDGLIAMADRLTLADVHHLILDVLTTDTLALADDTTHWRAQLSQMVDVLALIAGPASVRLNAVVAVAEALALDGAWRLLVPFTVADALGLADASADALEVTVDWVDDLAFDDATLHAANITALVSDTLNLTSAITSTAALVELIRDGVQFAVDVRLPDGVFRAWVLHAPHLAFNSYTGDPFISFAKIGGRYYGATDTGLHLLEGQDDAGAPIAAQIRAGLMDFGTAKLKRIPMLYLGYRSDGTLLLKVVVTSMSGDKDEHWYTMTERPATAMRENRIKIGRGLKSVYWGFALTNVDGADFELDHLTWAPLVLERRITT
ncbi:MAG: hypothetical protein L0H70_04535 [Xanthomonadales bacterium]|nr:hypothetical protein [Xanthomonadales bacterium]